MFGPIGIQELIVIFLVALLIFGPRKLPEIGKSIGKGLAEFKRASDDLKKTIEDEIEHGKKEAASVRREIGELSNTIQASPAGLSEPEPEPELEPEPETAPGEPDSRPIHPA